MSKSYDNPRRAGGKQLMSSTATGKGLEGLERVPSYLELKRNHEKKENMAKATPKKYNK